MTERIYAVHFHNTGTHFYFGSKKAIFDLFSPDDVGCSLATLYRAKTDKNGPLHTKMATIETGYIIRSNKNRK